MSRKIYYLSHDRAVAKTLVELPPEEMDKLKQGESGFVAHPQWWSEGKGVWPKFANGFLVERITEDKI